jgi:hypothetical protein
MTHAFPVNSHHRALLARHFNTLHGFNALTDKEELIIGRLSLFTSSDNREVSKILHKTLGLDGNTYKDYKFVDSSYAGDILCIPIPIRHRASELIEAARCLGYGVTLQTRLGVYYPPYLTSSSSSSSSSTPSALLVFSKEGSEIIVVIIIDSLCAVSLFERRIGKILERSIRKKSSKRHQRINDQLL